jgi:unsaturated pyranuronate lyase
VSALLANGTIEPLAVWPGVTVRAVHGERLTVAIAELSPNVLVPEHRHPNEQLGVVIAGSATFTTNGETRHLSVGSVYRFLTDVPHQVQAGPEGAVFIECFSPGRSDWMELSPEQGTTPGWPAAS